MNRKMFLITLLISILLGTSLNAQNYSFIHDGLTREYMLHIPSSYTGQTAVPLVIAFHGWNMPPADMETMSGLSVKADSAGFIVVYPKGTGSPLAWNEKETGVDDIGFISDLIDTLFTNYSIDTLRIYATGISNGGKFTFITAQLLSRRIAAIGPVCGPMILQQHTPERHMPIISFHAIDDGAIAYSQETPVLNYWINFNGCSTISDTILYISRGVTGVRWTAQSDHADVILYSTSEGGHSWPGGNQYWSTPTRVISATNLIWSFFVDHPLDLSESNLGIESENRLEHFELSANYPNPFNPITTIRYRLPEKSYVVLKVFDLLGREIAKLVDSEKPAGEYSNKFDGSALSSGIYFYRLLADQYSETRKMLLLK
jgi:polyhydroxybutyrate depolymerase